MAAYEATICLEAFSLKAEEILLDIAVGKRTTNYTVENLLTMLEPAQHINRKKETVMMFPIDEPLKVSRRSEIEARHLFTKMRIGRSSKNDLRASNNDTNCTTYLDKWKTRYKDFQFVSVNASNHPVEAVK
ncbi:hypothetical protein KIN20_012963 [Parelaphostrongylus tenuis]|uniref:Uncharacterized protein n=1 Tax=Parelaphostrongylus tenuis TaxID=148309 RepID=A0AAD5MVF7_PARTN|nr:hypothetical protein KIN20_012963 [Parelaphostrongylus tenuis]